MALIYKKSAFYILINDSDKSWRFNNVSHSYLRIKSFSVQILTIYFCVSLLLKTVVGRGGIV